MAIATNILEPACRTLRPVVLLVLTAGSALPAPADTIHVAPCGDDAWTGASGLCAAPNGPKRTIQAAINAAGSGDAITVAAGTYNEAINFNGKAVHLHSADGPETTIIDATGLHAPVVTCATGEQAATALEGFTITGGADGGMYNYGSSPTVTNCAFTGNTAGWGGGMNNDGGSPTVTNCAFTGNTAEWGGGMYNYGGTPTVTNCAFTRNTAQNPFPGGEGGGMFNDASSPTVTNCAFNGNMAAGGGGMSNWDSSNPTVTNCAFAGNTAYAGGGMLNCASRPTVMICTFAGNTAPQGGGMFNWLSGNPTLTNCILWGDSRYEIGGPGATVTYSDIQGGYAGVGNIDADPLFVRSPSPGDDGVWGTEDDEYGDLRLSAGSPCIDAADNTAVPMGITIDLAGDLRFRDDPATPDTGVGTAPIVDMGAYELSVCYADCDTSTGPGVPDVFDFLCFQNRFAAGAPYACDCDTQSGPSVCDIFDFLCFQNAFANGCP